MSLGIPDPDPIPEDGAAEAVTDPSRSQVRAGGRALSLLATPLNHQVLQALAGRPMRLAELRKVTGLPAQTTLRGHLSNLSDLGVLTKRPTRQMPYAVENELTPMGHELLDVAGQLEVWLRQAPDGPIPIESGTAKGAVKALIDGWSSTMMRALAVNPLSLTELDSVIPDLSYPALERRLSSMRIAGLVEARKGKGVGTPYTVTDWARLGVGPLASASRCELIHMGWGVAPVAEIDVEAAFLLATPLVGLPKDVAGSCQLEVEPSPGFVPRSTGVQVTIEQGKIVSCVSRLDPDPPAYAVGGVADWFNAVRHGKTDELRFGGIRDIAEKLVGGLHSTFVRD
jgi:DNA-binding HxlR family transcriptional regulator